MMQTFNRKIVGNLKKIKIYIQKKDFYPVKYSMQWIGKNWINILVKNIKFKEILLISHPY